MGIYSGRPAAAPSPAAVSLRSKARPAFIGVETGETLFGKEAAFLRQPLSWSRRRLPRFVTSRENRHPCGIRTRGLRFFYLRLSPLSRVTTIGYVS